MTKVKNSYEAVVMISSKLTEDEKSAIIKKIQDLIEANATLDGVDDWGKKRLAYQVNKESEAFYVLFKITSEPAFPAELERICKITSGIMRSLVINTCD